MQNLCWEIPRTDCRCPVIGEDDGAAIGVGTGVGPSEVVVGGGLADGY